MQQPYIMRPTRLFGPEVFVYRNLSKSCWSVRVYGRVLFHAEHLVMIRPEFKVNEVGRQRVIKEKRKNVHAGVSGRTAWMWCINMRYGADTRWTADPAPLNFEAPELLDGRAVTYNPYKGPHFVYKADGTSVWPEPDEYVVLDCHGQVHVGRKLTFEVWGD